MTGIQVSMDFGWFAPFPASSSTTSPTCQPSLGQTTSGWRSWPRLFTLYNHRSNGQSPMPTFLSTFYGTFDPNASLSAHENCCSWSYSILLSPSSFFHIGYEVLDHSQINLRGWSSEEGPFSAIPGQINGSTTQTTAEQWASWRHLRDDTGLIKSSGYLTRERDLKAVPAASSTAKQWARMSLDLEEPESHHHLPHLLRVWPILMEPNSI